VGGWVEQAAMHQFFTQFKSVFSNTFLLAMVLQPHPAKNSGGTKDAEKTVIGNNRSPSQTKPKTQNPKNPRAGCQ
jgi:hypothetical protein